MNLPCGLVLKVFQPTLVGPITIVTKKSQHKTTGKEVLLADFFSGFFFLLLGRATVLFGGSGVGATFV